MNELKKYLVEELELKQVNELEEIILARTCFLDAAYDEDKELPIYPVTKKANLTHDLLNLYGTHWRYFINKELELRRQDGDAELIINDIKSGRRIQRFACYAFTKKYLDNNKSLFLIVPRTKGWEYYNKVVLPKYLSDKQEYEQKKKKTLNYK